MKKNKKILLFTPSLSTGGSERVMAILADGLYEKNDVTLCLLREKEETYKLKQDVEIIKYKYNGKNKILKMLKRLMFMRKEIKKNEVIISFMYDINFMTLIAGFGLRKKIIISERGYPEQENKKSPIIPFLRKVLYPMADTIVFQTSQAMTWFPEKIKKKGVVIPNPVNDKILSPLKTEKEKRIIVAGRLTEQKNFHMLLRVFQKVVEKHSDFNLEICGDGPLKEELINLAKKLKIADKVIFSGFVSDINERMRKSFMYVSSSNYEGISNSMIEALAMGVPTICTDCPVGGAAMMIENEVSGLLIPVGDDNALYDGIIRIIENAEFRNNLVKNSIKIKNEYSVSKIVSKWQEICEG